MDGDTCGSAATISERQSILLRSSLDSRCPGVGLVDYPVEGCHSIPKSTAMIVLALANRCAINPGRILDPLLSQCGNLLIQDGLMGDGNLPGWGLPFAWDAYGDGTVNPPRTVYTISTALAIDALLTWENIDPSAPRGQIRQLVLETLLRYTDDKAFSPSGLFAYSLSSFDRLYDTFNPAAYLAGQMQRFAFRHQTEKWSGLLSEAAHRVISILLRNFHLDRRSGSVYWHYSLQEPVPNDLAHACYIAEGINTFARYGGKPEADIPNPVEHLPNFLVKSKLRAWPIFRSDSNDLARSYDAGIALACYSKWGESGRVRENFANALQPYVDSSGKVSKHPRHQRSPELVEIEEYSSAVFWGYSSAAAREWRNEQGSKCIPSINPNQNHLRNQLGDVTKTKIGETYVKSVPLVRYGSSLLETFVAVPDLGTFYLSGLTPRPWATEGAIPLSVRWSGNLWVLISRAIPTGHLTINLLDPFGEVIDSLTLDRGSTNSLLFRAIEVDDHSIYFCYYDDEKSTNLLRRFLIKDDRLLEAWTLNLPGVRYPAGATYEMTPNMYLAKVKTTLVVFCGELVAEIHPRSGQLVRSVYLRGFTILGISTRSVKKTRVWIRLNAASLAAGPITSMVRFSSGRPVFQLRSKARFLRLLGKSSRLICLKKFPYRPTSPDRFLELASSNSPTSGWNEFGLDNYLGRIAWSQIYFLEGLIDFLYISKRFPEAIFVDEMSLFDIEKRVSIEFQMLGKVLEANGFYSVTYSLDREPTQFAVQIGRVLRLFAKYEKVTKAFASHPSLRDFAERSLSLSAVCEREARYPSSDGQSRMDCCPIANCDSPGLFWPRGTSFKFDGVNVPLNHQNSWASGVLAYSRTIGSPDGGNMSEISLAKAIVEHFIHRLLPNGRFPCAREWPYWSDLGYRGWDRSLDISENTPESRGDQGVAWISFRTIDVVSVLELLLSSNQSLVGPFEVAEDVISQVKELKVFPLVAFEVFELMPAWTADKIPPLPTSLLWPDSGWQFQHIPWALISLLNQDSRKPRALRVP